MRDFLLSYDTVTLIPNHSDLQSRADADTSLIFCGHRFNLPVVPSNMNDVISIPIAKSLSENGYFYIHHRFDNIQNTTYNLVSLGNQENWQLISISVGVSRKDFDTLFMLRANGFRIDFITIDVAHADHDNVIPMVEFIKKEFPLTKLIVGNVATYHGAANVVELGIDAIKVGIGGGSICTTRYKTGFHLPTLQSIYDANLALTECNFGDVGIIADGGAKHYGDIAKALTFGANMVMNGQWFASCINSPAKSIDGKKLYRGSTSQGLRGNNRHVEGQQIELENTDITYLDRFLEIKQALQSSISYAGGNDLSAFDGVKYERILPFH